MPAAVPPSSIESATYTIRHAAIRAGVSTRTLWRWIDARRLPGVLRQGRVVRINKKLFEQWLENGGAK